MPSRHFSESQPFASSYFFRSSEELVLSFKDSSVRLRIATSRHRIGHRRYQTLLHQQRIRTRGNLRRVPLPPSHLRRWRNDMRTRKFHRQDCLRPRTRNHLHQGSAENAEDPGRAVPTIRRGDDFGAVLTTRDARTPTTANCPPQLQEQTIRRIADPRERQHPKCRFRND